MNTNNSPVLGVVAVDYADLTAIMALQNKVFGEDSLPLDIIETLLEEHIFFHKIVMGTKPDLLGFAITGSIKTGFFRVADCILDRYQDQLQSVTHLINFAIQPDYHHQGLGSFLFRKIFQRLQVLGFRTLYLEVNTNNIPAINFYKKHGFQVLEECKEYYRSGGNALVMILPIT